MIELLISTLNDGVYDAVSIPLGFNPDLCYLIVHQVSNSKHVDYEHFFNTKFRNRDDVRYIQSSSLGLSKSRNLAMRNIGSKTSIAYFCDDDVVLSKDFSTTVLSALESECDVASFKIKTNNELPFKSYKKHKFQHSLFTLMRVSSIEIAVKVSFLKLHNVNFDEDFGLGAKYIASEENIFLSDLYRKGAKICFFPLYTMYHPPESSGGNWSSEQLIIAKGPFFKRVFGSVNGFIILFLFAIKKYPEYRKFLSLLSFLRISLASFFKYKHVS